MNKLSLSFLLTILLSMPSISVLAYDIAVENDDSVTIYYNYIKNYTELEVTYKTNDYNSYKGVVHIPETVTYMNRTRKVTSIGNNAFHECRGLTSITIPNSVTSIGMLAFEWCNSLTSITIPNSVTSIGLSAFFSCKLTSVHISDIEAWCKIVFSDGDSNPLCCAQRLYLNGVEIKNLVIPNNVTSIGAYAFYRFRGLTSVTIPNSVTSIEKYAFWGCSGLTSVTIPNSVTSIEDQVFTSCVSLSSVTIPNSVTSIGKSAFSSCTGLTSIYIPNSVTTIGNWAFSYCSSLTSITIPNSVTSIGGDAFSYCSGLTSINIPNSVTKIEHQTFYNCTSLTSITIPNSVTSIEQSAFKGCASLICVTIPNSVTSIGLSAFDGCDIPEVISKIENPFNIDTNTFTDNTYYNATLYVPKGTIDKYKATEGWKRFAFIEESVPNGVAELTVNEIMIESDGGTLTIHGAEDGTLISVFDTNGTQVGSTVSCNGQATINTILKSGNVAIMKIGQKSVKVVVK